VLEILKGGRPKATRITAGQVEVTAVSLVLQSVFDVLAKFSTILAQLAPVALELLYFFSNFALVPYDLFTILLDFLQVLGDLLEQWGQDTSSQKRFSVVHLYALPIRDIGAI
jgi:hypothetical protein